MGVEAIVKGLSKYLTDLGKMGSAAQHTGGLLGGLGGAAVAVGGTIATAGIAAAVAAVAAAATGLAAATAIGIREALQHEEVMAKLDATLAAVGTTMDATSNQSFTLAWRQGNLQDALAALGTELSEDERKAFLLAWQEGNLEKATAAVGAIMGVTREEAIRLSEQYKDLAGGSDEAVLSAETVLLRFSQLRGKAFEPALQVTLDLAAALGTDAATAAGMLGRALEVPGEGLRALKAAGIVLTDQQKDMIDRMVETGDVAGAQKFLLDALTGTIGGTAARAAKTFGGRMQIMKEHLLDSTEAIGNALIPVLERLADFMQPVLDGIQDFIGLLGPVLGENADKVVDAMTELWASLQLLAEALGFKPSAEGILGVIGTVTDTIVGIIDKGREVVNWLRETLPGALEEARTTFQPLIDGVTALFSAFGEKRPEAEAQLQGFADFWNATILPALTVVSENVKGIIEGLGGLFQELAIEWQAHGDEVMAVVGFIFTFIAGTITAAFVAITGIINTALAILNGDWAGAWEAMKQTFVGFFNAAAGIVGVNLDSFIATWRNNFEMARLIVVTVFDRIRNAISSVINGIIQKVSSLAQQIEDAIPDWLIPGSPTEFELGIRGINRALDNVRLPTMNVPPTTMPPGGAGLGGTTDNSRNVSIGTVVNRDRISSQAFDLAMRDWLGA
jgi:hypothetical protein